MGESVVLVCDICGQPAAETVSIKAGRVNRQKDLCGRHLTELLSGTRAPKRGRSRATALPGAAPSEPQRASVGAGAKRRGRPPGSKNKNPSGNGRRRKNATLA